MTVVQTMQSFVRAHMQSQELMIKYYSNGNSPLDNVELARCLLQSFVAAHRAIFALLNERKLNERLCKGVHDVTFRKHIIEHLKHFIHEAVECGAITAKNAASLLHPLYHEVSECIAYVNLRFEGITSITFEDIAKDFGGRPSTEGVKLIPEANSFQRKPSAEAAALPAKEETEAKSLGKPKAKTTLKQDKKMKMKRDPEDEQGSSADGQALPFLEDSASRAAPSTALPFPPKIQKSTISPELQLTLTKQESWNLDSSIQLRK